ncbi:membrane dipeptidase-domain-containing protein [Crassisporium funariophilum]|nr:membrane dipeptidase-domain-containing protein [Crassisporium funariophilum]
MTTNQNQNNNHSSETSPLLASGHSQDAEDQTPRESNPKVRGVVWGALTVVFVTAIVLLVGFQRIFGDAFAPWLGILPSDPMLAALVILDQAPVIDGHIDLPILARMKYANNVSAIDMESDLPMHVDIPRLRKGKVGGFFWSTYVSCPNPDAAGKNFLGASWRVRDTLEQIDISKLLIAKYPDTFSLSLTAEDIETAIAGGKIASLLGVEGGHQLGNSIAVLRQYHALGVRYVTLTHMCHNAFADSCGYYPGMIPLHGGLSSLGRSLIDEMNRLGVLVDLSHTSDATATQALLHSKAPVIWSHSSARAVHDVPRNVPDDVLKLIGRGKGLTDAVVMVNFAPFFVAVPGNATVDAVADHVDHIAKVAGKEHVGLGSDFDGIADVPVGLEDVSKYPALISNLYQRGWNKYELAGLTGANLLRVLKGAEKVAQDLQAAKTAPVVDLYHKRKDIPAYHEDL